MLSIRFMTMCIYIYMTYNSVSSASLQTYNYGSVTFFAVNVTKIVSTRTFPPVRIPWHIWD